MANKTFQTAGISTPDVSPISKSHVNLSTMDIGSFRVPYWEELLPNDDIQINLSQYVRASPMAGPVFGNYRVCTQAFFVPCRLLWDKFQDFITGGATGRSSYNLPVASVGNFYARLKAVASQNPSAEIKARTRDLLNLYIDMGLPLHEMFPTINEGAWVWPTLPSALSSGTVNLLPFRGLSKVWFDWFRDSNLISDDAESAYFTTSSNSGVTSSTTDFSSDMFKACHGLSSICVPWEKDYFTTAFTDPQRGAASIVNVNIADSVTNPGLKAASTDRAIYTNTAGLSGDDVRKVYTTNSLSPFANNIIGTFDILAFRAASALQKFLERSNIGGATKLTQLLAHWGVSPSPAVMQMSEYLGRNESSLNIDEVTALADTSEISADGSGTLGDVATKINGTADYTCHYHAKEHGYIYVIQFIRPERIYLPAQERRLFNRGTKEDWFNPEFENISYQPIYSKELNPNSSPDVVFGYAPRYAEYKFAQSRYSGQYATSLYSPLRITEMKGASSLNSHITTGFTMISDYSKALMDNVFATTDPLLDHLIVRWTLDVGMKRPMHPYGMSTISDITGRDITIPYGGVRL